MNIFIGPTVGRVVWFYPAFGSPIPHIPGIPLAATIAWVEDEATVNLSVSDMSGAIWPVQNVHLVQEDSVYETDAARAEWMPYQIGQAKAAAEPVQVETSSAAKPPPAKS